MCFPNFFILIVTRERRRVINLERFCDRVLFVKFAGGDRGERCRGQVEHDPALLPRGLHQGLQEDHRRRLSREAHEVSARGWIAIIES